MSIFGDGKNLLIEAMSQIDHMDMEPGMAAGGEGCKADALTDLTRDPGSSMVFDHEGVVDHSVVHVLLARAEEVSLATDDPVTVRKRLFSVLTEGLENIHHHNMSEAGRSSFARMTRTTWGYRLVLGNIVPPATAALLCHRVDILNAMDDADLKAQYLKLLSMQERTERGGAGLGLITMARKSTGPMRTHCHNLEDGRVCFALELTVQAG